MGKSDRTSTLTLMRAARHVFRKTPLKRTDALPFLPARHRLPYTHRYDFYVLESFILS